MKYLAPIMKFALRSVSDLLFLAKILRWHNKSIIDKLAIGEQKFEPT